MGCVPVVRTVRLDCRQLLVSNGILVVLMSVIMVATALVSHLFPFRTEKLSPTAPMVLRKRESRSPPPFFKSSRIPFSGPVPGEGFAFSDGLIFCFSSSPLYLFTSLPLHLFISSSLHLFIFSSFHLCTSLLPRFHLYAFIPHLFVSPPFVPFDHQHFHFFLFAVLHTSGVVFTSFSFFPSSLCAVLLPLVP